MDEKANSPLDKIFIRDLRVTAILGVLDWERETPREILVNVTVFTDPRPVSRMDDLEGCVDYDLLAKDIRALVERARRFTVEALAEDIAGLCLGRLPVRKAIVRVEKPGAVDGANSVGVEIERSR